MVKQKVVDIVNKVGEMRQQIGQLQTILNELINTEKGIDRQLKSEGNPLETVLKSVKANITKSKNALTNKITSIQGEITQFEEKEVE